MLFTAHGVQAGTNLYLGDVVKFLNYQPDSEQTRSPISSGNRY